MFTLKIGEKWDDFDGFLEDFSTKQDEEKYVFTSKERASEIISCYINYHIREKIVQEQSEKYNLTKEEKNKVSHFIPESVVYHTLMSIQKKIKELIIENLNEFNIGGFIQFRIQDELEQIEESAKYACTIVLSKRKI